MRNKFECLPKLLTVLGTILFANLICAAEFVATIAPQQIELGQSVVLNLTLNDANATEAPDLYKLTKDFSIYSQQQYSSFNNSNGNIVSEFGWDITLLPKKTGTLTIPSIEIHTNKGKLSTQAITLTVGQAQTSKLQDKDNLGVSLVSSTSKSSVYVKEPLVYTLKIISYKSLANVALEDIKSTDATIDKIGQPKQYDQSFGGVRAHIIEIKYYITPIVAGKITIAPATIRGEVQADPQVPGPRSNRFGGMLNNFFLDSAIPFKPFTLKGEKITFNAITPPVKGNWLPLQKLELTEEWEGISGAKVGDTIIRRIKMVATGILSNQLPSLKEFVDQKGFKVYADNPVLNDTATQNNEAMVATKEETFTLVPQDAGNISLPEIKISWWNLRTKKSQVSTLPGKTIAILPAANAAVKDPSVDFSATAVAAAASKPVDFSFKQNKLLYILIASLVTVIISLFAVIIYLLRRRSSTLAVNTSKPKQPVLKIQSDIKSAADLRDHILVYAEQHWQTPANITLNKLGTVLSNNNYSYDLEMFVLLCTEINAAVYASEAVNLDVLLRAWEKLRTSVRKIKDQTATKSNEKYIDLNPT